MTGDRIKVQAVRAANGRIQGWAINKGNRELAFYPFTRCPLTDRTAHESAMVRAQRIARGEIR